MHDLNTINRLNYEAHVASISAARAEGKFVVAKYEGLHLIITENFDEAPVVKSGATDSTGGRVQVFEPFSDAERAAYAGRDQSEDYAH